MSKQTYGIPYQGSKSRIAEELIKVLSQGKRFVDLFGGSGAVSHIASLSDKYEKVLYNDLLSNLSVFIKDAINGKYSFDNFIPSFITRNKFFEEKENDAYIKYIWSFGDNGRDYLFSKDIEKYKESVHNFVIFNIRDEYIEGFFSDITINGNNLIDRLNQWKAQTKNNKYVHKLSLNRLLPIERLRRVQQLEELQGKDIEFTSIDYKDYKYIDGDIVYCDPPYESARGYGKKFNIEDFYDWVSTRDYSVYFSSYADISDKRFPPIWQIEKRNLAREAIEYDVRLEVLYCNQNMNKVIQPKRIRLF